MPSRIVETRRPGPGEALRTRVFSLGGEHDHRAAGLDGLVCRRRQLETHRPWGGWYGHYERSPKTLIGARLMFLP